MYKDKEKQRATERERQRRYRKGVTEGVTHDSLEQPSPFRVVPSVTSGDAVSAYSDMGMTPDIIDKLTDPRWRKHLEKVCSAFKASSNPSYSKDVWLGNTNLSIVCDWLEVTR